MQLRNNVHRLGITCWTHSSNQAPLPDHIPDNHPVTVLANHGMELTVRAADGQEWTLPHWNFQRLEYQGRGGLWHDEGEPAVLDYLQSRHRQMSAERWDAAIEHARQDTLIDLAAILQRHGRSIPE